MKDEFLNLVICPNCEENALKICKCKDIEECRVYNGRVKCEKCGENPIIRQGILDLLIDTRLKDSYHPRGNKGNNKTIRSIVKNRGAGMSLSPSDIANRRNLEKDWVRNTKVNFEDVLKRLNLTGEERVLEIGAGTCWAIDRFAKFGCECVAVDISVEKKLEMGDFWFKKENIFFHRLLCDMDRLLLIDNAFDIVFSCSALMYSRNLLSGLREIHRVLKQGGKVVLSSEPVTSSLPFISRLTFGSGHSYKISNWIKMIRKAGFSNIQLLFPKSVEDKLNHTHLIYNKKSWYYFVAKMTSPIWRRDMIKGLIKNHGVFFWLLLSPIPTPLVLVADKK